MRWLLGLVFVILLATLAWQTWNAPPDAEPAPAPQTAPTPTATAPTLDTPTQDTPTEPRPPPPLPAPPPAGDPAPERIEAPFVVNGVVRPLPFRLNTESGPPAPPPKYPVDAKVGELMAPPALPVSKPGAAP